jgi:pyruvate dehydrogenase E1 component alpha subunit
MPWGTGEEAIVASVVSQLQPGDALALDHRGTPPLLMRGVDPVLILREMLGHPEGLCGGQGGHMHLFAKEYLAASSGIVGSAGPAAAGFALAAQYLRPGTIAVAFFGEGAMNQGMLLESMNLAAAWHLPALFVCKDDAWSITTESRGMTGGDLSERARGLGLYAIETDGRDVTQVWQAAQQAIEHTRFGQGPTFLRARCVHLEGHFLGYQLLRITRQPLREMPRIAGPLTRSLLRREGAPLRQRFAGLRIVLAAVLATMRDPRRDTVNDPVAKARAALQSEPARLREMEDRVKREIDRVVATAVSEKPP